MAIDIPGRVAAARRPLLYQGLVLNRDSSQA